jgi:methionyl-tRNA formyltransferase
MCCEKAAPRLRIAFMGTPDFAVKALDALVPHHEIVCVYSQPPRPAGRGHKLQPSAVHRRAEELSLPVRTPLSLKKDQAAQEEFAALNLDVAVVAAYGLILPEVVLNAPRYGCLNIHASLLPRWRGAAPIQRAILAEDDKSGVCIMQMDKGLDTGAVLLRGETTITDTTTAQTLHDALAEIGSRLIVEALEKIEMLTPEAQSAAGITYAHMLTKDEGRIDWAKPAAVLARQVRALTPWPGVWCEANGQRLKVLESSPVDGVGKAGVILDHQLTIACGEGALRLKTVQPQDRKPMDGLSFINGGAVKVGDILT